MTSETVRITFKTPQPFYPYREPSNDQELPHARAFSLWFVSPDEMLPVAAMSTSSAYTREEIRAAVEEAHRAGTYAAAHADMPLRSVVTPNGR